MFEKQKEQASTLKWYLRPIFYTHATIVAIVYKIVYNPYNPWSIAILNACYQKYTETTMHEERLKLEREDRRFKDYAYNAYMKNGEVWMFRQRLNKNDWLKIIFTPFSFPNVFCTYWYRKFADILVWLGGSEYEE